MEWLALDISNDCHCCSNAGKSLSENTHSAKKLNVIQFLTVYMKLPFKKKTFLIQLYIDPMGQKIYYVPLNYYFLLNFATKGL